MCLSVHGNKSQGIDLSQDQVWLYYSIILVTLRMVPAQSRILRRGDHTPFQILNLMMMLNGKGCREGRQQQESHGIPSAV